MSFTVKIGILAAVVVAELITVGLVGLRLLNRGQLPAVLALAVSSVATVVVVGYVLFAVVD